MTDASDPRVAVALAGACITLALALALVGWILISRAVSAEHRSTSRARRAGR